MNIGKPSIDVSGLLTVGNRTELKKEETAQEFERLFARQLVQQMTRGLFENDEKNPMMGGSNGIYRDHVVDTLSTELAKQEKLGMAEMVRRYWEERTGGDSGSGGAPAKAD